MKTFKEHNEDVISNRVRIVTLYDDLVITVFEYQGKKVKLNVL